MSPAGICLPVYYGGTFDPIHNAHLAIAAGVRDALDAEVHLVPAADPPHREPPGASAGQRAQMVRLAVAGQPGLLLDTIELERARRAPQRPSYTVDTLAELRQHHGSRQPLAWLIGGDSLGSLHRWHQWPRLFELAHVVVVGRPGHLLPDELPAPLRQVLAGRGWCRDAADLRAQAAGCLYPLPLPLREGSATAVRQAIAAGRPVDTLVPAAVAAYLRQQELYRPRGG